MDSIGSIGPKRDAKAVRQAGRGQPNDRVHVLVSNVDHLPLYRERQIDARSGLDLDRSTLVDWVGNTHVLLTY